MRLEEGNIMTAKSLSIAIAVLMVTSAVAIAEDEMFSQSGSEGLVSQATEPDRSLADDLLTSDEGLTFSGDYAVVMESVWDDVTEDRTQSATVEGTLNIEARPESNLRMLTKLDYQLDQQGDLDTTVREWFGDVTLDDRVFVRAGQQTLTWGVGYFYSPADVVNTSDIDPLDPEADRTGVMSVRMQVPVGTSNYYLYSLPTDEGVDLAAKGEWVLGGAEVGLGLVVQDDGANTLMTTLVRPVGDVDVFAEGVLTRGDEYRDFTSEGLGETREDDFLPQATVGAKATLSEDDDYQITVTGQYFYNGRGYDEAYWQSESVAWTQAVVSGDVSTQNPGQHYVGASAQWQEVLQSDVSLSLTTLTNLTDESWLVQPKISVAANDAVEVALETRHDRGDTGGTYSPLGERNQIKLTLTLTDIDF